MASSRKRKKPTKAEREEFLGSFGGEEPQKWPNLPQFTVSTGGHIEVVRSPEVSERGFMGTYETQTRRIRVAAEMNPEVAWATFFHEVVEAAIHDSGLHNVIITKKQKALKEGICDAVAMGMLAQFKHENGL